MTEVSLPTFAVFAAVALICAAMVVTRKNPVHSALYLIVTLFSLAAIYVLLRAEFLAAVQVLVYAGGIMVLFLFVIFLVRPPGDRDRTWRHGPHVVLAVVLALLVIVVLGAQVFPEGDQLAGKRFAVDRTPPNLEWVSTTLFRHYLLPFETVSILLLVAMVGAIVLAKPGD
jgi:NADH-quinone oxidoreductase subunit J